MEKPHILVVGGGLAGLSAALACIDGGARVTVLEARPRLGGATWSFQRNGLSFDNGQHVYLRCCTAYQGFLERIGSAHDAPIQGPLSIPVYRPRAGSTPVVSFIRRNNLPAPMHLAGALMRYRHLSVRERLGLGRALVALQRLQLEDQEIDTITFGEFLASHGQGPRAIDCVWDLITLPTVNVRAAEASLFLGAKVFKTGLLSRSDAADIGWSQIPLSRLHVDPAVQLLRRAGAVVRERAKVQTIELDPHAQYAVAGVRADSQFVSADAVVLAVPHDAAAELLPTGAIEHPEDLAKLGSSPIVDVHVIYDRVVTEHAFVAAVDSPVQFVFDKTVAAGLDPNEGQCLAVSISGADAEHGERPEVLIDRYQAALAELFPKAKQAVVKDAVVSREHHATFRGRPGMQQIRPPTSTAMKNLFLAGAWTDTGWPATMEGAVRSGLRAGAQALRSVGQTRHLPGVPEEVPA